MGLKLELVLMTYASNLSLSFPMVNYGATETPWNLLPLLYRGASSIRPSRVKLLIDANKLGDILSERIDLVAKLHARISEDLLRGGSRYSAISRIGALRQFFSWCDERDEPLSLTDVASSFLRWCDHLVHLQRTEGSITLHAIYTKTRLVSYLLDSVLERQVSLSKSTRIRKPRSSRHVVVSRSDKQDIEQTFAFGHALSDMCDGISWEASLGALPVSIKLRTGQLIELWSGLRDPKEILASSVKARSNRELELSAQRRIAYEADASLSTRYPLVNLRVSCELLIFIAQTGFNYTQAHSLRMDQFHYTSYINGYQVRAYKRRREGEVLFEIFEAYRPWFDRYLNFRNKWFPDDPEGLVFPLVRKGGRGIDSAPQLSTLKRVLNGVGVIFVSPQKLRGVRINWLLRETLDEQQTAQLAQHSVETLRRVYSKPHPQIAKIEISRFHQKNDLSLSSPAPGRCVNAIPSPYEETPSSAPIPDCTNAAGCLFCSHHRDLDSLDHVWSLSSLKYLKTVELSRYLPNRNADETHPAFLVIQRIADKLEYFEKSSTVRKSWVEEARERVKEGNYHPAWDVFIRLAESIGGDYAK